MITIKSKKEIEIMREGGRLLSKTLQQVANAVKPGVVISDLDAMARELLEQGGGRPAFLHYQPLGSTSYPATLCISINNEVVHGIGTRDIELKDGDIVGLDIGVQYPAQGGLYTDMAVTVPVGNISEESKKLLEVTKKSLDLAIEKMAPGLETSEISKTVQEYCESFGYGVVRDLTGHGVGHKVHEEPPIFNYYDPRAPRVKLKPGMVICIEPMITMGDWRVVTDRDGWTIKTRDKSLAAHFEHTIAVTDNGYEVLTNFE